MKRTTAFQNGLIWFGAGVSLAEILTGTYFAPLGMGRGIAAILLGHVIGCVLFFLAGLIGGRERKSSMETVKMSFGAKGGMLFAFLNVVQLVGWTGIMIYDGALATNSIFDVGIAVWSIVIGVMIVIWIAIGVTNLGLLNKITMALLFILTVVLSVVVFRGNNPGATSGEVITFGMAVENAVAMPLSWLPVISDYTREADKPFRATLASTVTYGLVSCWMYVIGMGAAIYTGGSDIAQVMLKAGLGISALLIMILSTVTTTFLDAFSAGVSCESLSKKLSGKTVGIIATVIGTIGACVYNMDNIMGFLYIIGSVFAPMIAVQLTTYFILKKDSFAAAFDWPNLIVWAVGFAVYRLMMHVDLPTGYTLPSVLITMVLCFAVNKLIPQKSK
ncbi:MAG TPA: putative hydroxymethylpyrimidine transporter CytX [Candidatus Scatomorpha stercorigallinarum]|nr:putative hydroxymethylpyrimidine transporter CytX [Candidatus Scatomorpha stercorigallinarum]